MAPRPSPALRPPSRFPRGVLVAVIAILAAFGAVPLAQAAVQASPAPQAAAEPVRAGVKPIHPAGFQAAKGNTLAVGSSASTGVVSPHPKVFLVFWGSQWSKDPAGAAADLQKFFKGLFGSADNWGTIMNQYCEGVKKGTTTCGSAGTHIQHPTASILGGVWSDNGAAAPNKATATQIGNEAVKAAQHFGNTSQTPNLNAQYVIASPTGTHPDGFNTPSGGFCAWHSSMGSSVGTVAFTNLPYVPDTGKGGCTTLSNARLLDGYESTETHEYAETITDFFPAKGWNGGGGEIGDECQNLDRRIKLSTGTFDVQGLWSNDLNKCVTSE